MSKATARNAPSPFDALRIARLSQATQTADSSTPPAAADSAPAAETETVRHLTSQSSEHLDIQTVTHSETLAKSKNPAYVKFTTYINRDIHLRVKALAVRHELELSELVEGLLVDWLKRYPESKD